ncbi:peptidase S8/S53 domain-containing protein [Ilyonectria robusta]|uniref:peptidase S8/S53 domain-containing protein n=1 Tax=Ilyonectria robusta TaxID=1079257 RepID=UPI001E8E6378|nr:peptidase S8/S53 domain-containing protein [Ilyonectria robusta]KAH8734643.1 peptidase S8/S53 domain-containing protein [Ilyonectria robusta]
MVNFTNLALVATTLLGYAIGAPVERDSGSVVKGSYIITLKSELKTDDLENHLTWVNDVHKRSVSKRDSQAKGVEITYDGDYGFHGYAGSFDSDTIEEIKNNPEVALVEEDKVWKLQYIKEETELSHIAKKALTTQSSSTWGLGTVSHRSSGYTSYIYDTAAGEGTYAYIVDTGIRATHNEFESRATAIWSAFSGDNADTNGHGTHVAGTIGGKTYGVAKLATLLGVKVFQGDESTTSIILSGYNWAVNHIVNNGRASKAVINMSLGGDYSATFNNAVASASSSGVLTVVAAGNEAQSAANVSPASAASAITVGAIDSSWAIAYYSNYGTSLDIFGPGSSVLSAYYSSNSATATLSGTSMASPHIAGLALYGMSVEGVSGVSGVTSWLKSAGTANGVTGTLRSSPNLIGNNDNSSQ